MRAGIPSISPNLFELNASSDDTSPNLFKLKVCPDEPAGLRGEVGAGTGGRAAGEEWVRLCAVPRCYAPGSRGAARITGLLGCWLLVWILGSGVQIVILGRRVSAAQRFSKSLRSRRGCSARIAGNSQARGSQLELLVSRGLV